jgi:thiol-disulfide isomerase/thioredoxin
MLLAAALIPLALLGPAPAGPDPAVSEARAAFYRRAFPDARQFVSKPIAAEGLPAEDRGNETYVEARDAKGTLLGYLRDFAGPIAAVPTCGCHPLSFTLALDPQLRLKTLLSEAPIEKYGHAPMTPEDMVRLVEIVRDPPAALMKTPRTEDVVDAVTGATRTEFHDMVVPHAALTTRRIAGIVQDTVRVLSGAPLARDRQALGRLLEGKTDPLALATTLADFIPQAESEDVRSQAFDMLIHYYSLALQRRLPRQPSVESRLLDASEAYPGDVARACQTLANRAQALDLVQTCVRRLAPQAAKVDAGSWAMLRGTEAFENGRTAEAVPALEAAAEAVLPSVDPALHLRLVQALSAVGRKADGCSRIKALLRSEPLYPGAATWLSLCPEPEDVLTASLREERHQEVLKGRRADGTPLPKLSLTDDQGKAVQLDLAHAGRTHVLIFFAAWCPHCQADFPAFKELAEAVARDPSLREKIRVLGVRTYSSKDVEPWPDFARRFAPNFPVWSDAPDGDTLKALASTFGFSAGIPRLLVVDDKGILRFMVDADPYREISRELLWAAQAAAVH